jgi:hypothetical protein
MHVKSTYASIMFLNNVLSFEVSNLKYLVNYNIIIPPKAFSCNLVMFKIWFKFRVFMLHVLHVFVGSTCYACHVLE